MWTNALEADTESLVEYTTPLHTHSQTVHPLLLQSGNGARGFTGDP